MTLRPFYSRVRVSQKIREIRNDLGMTQKQFAEALGAPESQGQVSRWENAAVVPEEDTLRKIAELADKPEDYFVDWPAYGGRGQIGGVLIEVLEHLAERFPREELVDALEEFVESLLEDDIVSDADLIAWDSYLRGAGVIRRGASTGSREAAAAETGKGEGADDARRAVQADAEAPPPTADPSEKKTGSEG